MINLQYPDTTKILESCSAKYPKFSEAAQFFFKNVMANISYPLEDSKENSSLLILRLNIMEKFINDRKYSLKTHDLGPCLNDLFHLQRGDEEVVSRYLARVKSSLPQDKDSYLKMVSELTSQIILEVVVAIKSSLSDEQKKQYEQDMRDASKVIGPLPTADIAALGDAIDLNAFASQLTSKSMTDKINSWIEQAKNK